MSVPTGATQPKRSVPVPPVKPKLGGGPPKGGATASTGTVPPGGLGNSVAAGSTSAGGAWQKSGDSTANVAHRRVASASPSVQTVQPVSNVSSPPGGPPSGPPKIAPKPPGRPKSGAFSIPNAASSGSIHSDSIPPHLILSSTNLKALAESYSVSNTELDSLQLLFLEMDTDNDGVVSIADFLKYKYGSRKAATPEDLNQQTDPAESSIESSPSTINISIESRLVPSSSAPRLIQVGSTEDDDSDSDDSLENAKKMLQDMDLTESSEDDLVDPPTTDSITDTSKPQQGLSFRHIDFASLPQTDNQSSDDDHLLADWDGPPDDDSKSTDSKSSKPKSASSSPFGGLRKKFSKGALNLKSKLNAAGK